MVCERIADFFKHYLCGSNFFGIGDTITKTPGDDIKEQARAYRILKINIWCGILTALILKADLIKIFNYIENPGETIGWNAIVNYEVLDYIFLIPGIILTGCFISFGSKFWHDLLDILLEVKNLKRKMVDDNTFKVESIEQLDEYVVKTYSDIIQTAINQNSSAFNHEERTSPPMHGRMLFNGKLVDCIDIHLSGTSSGKIPTTVNATLQSGAIVHVPVKIVFEVDEPVVLVSQDDSVANNSIPKFKGTICCKLRNTDGENLLTCSHVLTGGTAENMFGKIKKTVAANIAGNVNGNFIWALQTEKFDIALVRPEDFSFNYKIAPEKERRLTADDVLLTTVKIVCRDFEKGGAIIKEATVTNQSIFNQVFIKYGKQKIGITNLIALSKVTLINGTNSFETVTEPGDSGACVYDNNNKPVGMIIAGNKKFSYAIPIVDILNELKAIIIK